MQAGVGKTAAVRWLLSQSVTTALPPGTGQIRQQLLTSSPPYTRISRISRAMVGIQPEKSQSGKSANSICAGSKVADYWAEDWLMKKR